MATPCPLDPFGTTRAAKFLKGEIPELIREALERIPRDKTIDPRVSTNILGDEGSDEESSSEINHHPDPSAAVPLSSTNRTSVHWTMYADINANQPSRALRSATQETAPNNAETREAYNNSCPKYADSLRMRKARTNAAVLANNPAQIVDPPHNAHHPARPLTRKIWRKLIRQLPLRSSGGPSGLRFSILRDLGEIAIDLAQTYWEEFSTGALTANTRGLFRLARGVSIPKKDGGTRPLAVGESLRRLLSKGVCHAIGNPRIEAAAGPYQFAAGTVAGTDIAGLVPRIFMERAAATGNPMALVNVDCKNAFQNVDRYLMLKKVRHHLPEAYGAAVNLYDGDSLIVLHPNPDAPYSTASSQQGVHQGCVFGSIFFCIAIRDALSLLVEDLKRAHPLHSLSAFADDATLHVHPEFAAAALHAATVRLGRCNLPVQTKKTQVYCTNPHTDFTQQAIPPPAHDPRALQDDFPGYRPDDSDTFWDGSVDYTAAADGPPPPLPAPIVNDIQNDDVWKCDGITVAGTPIGEESYIEAVVKAKTDKTIKAAAIARDYASDPQIPYAVQGGNALFRLCIMTKLAHLARVTIYNPTPRATLHRKDPAISPPCRTNRPLRELLSKTEDALFLEYLRMVGLANAPHSDLELRIDDNLRHQLSAPMRYGGIGLCGPTSIAAAASAGAIGQSITLMHARGAWSWLPTDAPSLRQ